MGASPERKKASSNAKARSRPTPINKPRKATLKRKKTPANTEADVLLRSARRCCLCYGLKEPSDLDQKDGQIAHLDRDPSNYDFDNLAFLCVQHHGEYDTKSPHFKGLQPTEVKRHRGRLYDEIERIRQGKRSWPSQDVPLLAISRPLEPTLSIPAQGIQFIDKNPEDQMDSPLLYLSVYYKTTGLFSDYQSPSSGEKWLFVQADMRFALNLRIQVRAWNMRDVDGLMDVLNHRIPGWSLQGPRPDENEKHAGDYLYIWRENNENRMMISTFTATHAGISIHARLTDEVMQAFAQYLDECGFTQGQLSVHRHSLPLKS